jgi:cytochrome c oxidase cbb3-type subunit 3
MSKLAPVPCGADGWVLYDLCVSFCRHYLSRAVLVLLSIPPGISLGQSTQKAAQSESEAVVANGRSLFQQNCAFCHGRDASGGETGPSLNDSKLVEDDVKGDKIGAVVRNGRPEKGMPSFKFSEQDLASVVAFIHYQRNYIEKHPGGRRGVSVSDLQTGNSERGKEYFNSNCSSCHSATGDLAGIGKKYQGLTLERRFLYPEGATAKVTVTLKSGEKVTGKLAYQDEFTVGLRDSDGWYHSWPLDAVTYEKDAPAEKHADLLGQYTDDDIHNLMAYLQTLR